MTTRIVNRITVQKEVKALWELLSPLDFSFLSPKIESVLIQPALDVKRSANRSDKEQDKVFDKANTERSYSQSWKAPNTVRALLINEAIADPVLFPLSGTPHETADLLFSHQVRLNSIDENKHTVTYSIVHPSSFAGTPLSSLSHTVTLTPADGNTATVEITSEDSNASEAVQTFAARYQQFLLSSLQRALNNPYPYTPRRAVLDEYVTTVLLDKPEEVTQAILDRGVVPTPNEKAGNIVSDPFRYLEDPDSAETRAWVDSQNELTARVLATCTTRAQIKDQLMKMYQYTRYSQPSLRGNYWYYSKNDGLQNQAVIYQAPATFKDGKVVLPSGDLEASARVFIDPSAIDKSGKAALGSRAWNHDHTMYAYGVCLNGSDWTTVRVLSHTDAISTEKPLVPDTVAEQSGDAVDVLEWVKFSSISWAKDNSGFFYCRYPAPASVSGSERGKRGTETDAAASQRVYFHKVGTAQKADACIWREEKEHEWMASAAVTDCGEWLLLSISDSCDPKNKLWVARMPQLLAAISAGGDASTVRDDTPVNVAWTRVCDTMESEYTYVANEGSTLIVQTNNKAPRGRICALDILPYLQPRFSHVGELSAFNAKSAEEQQQLLAAAGLVAATDAVALAADNAAPALVELVPQHATGVLSSSVCAGNKLFLVFTIDVLDYIFAYTLQGKALAFDTSFLPNCASLSLFGERDCSVISISATSPLHPGISYTVPVGMDADSLPQGDWPVMPSSDASAAVSGHSAVVFKESKPTGFVAEDYIVKQHFYTTKDGTRVPMLTMHHRDMPLDGKNPAYLYAYGGFNISLTPSFSASRWLWAGKFGGVCAVANLRGGGEYGEEWHKAGCFDKKQNVFDDMHAAAEALCSLGYTQKGKIAIHGGSNGGLLVGACSNQRGRELYGAAVAAVGVLDMLRFHKFTIGYAWCSDYGCSEADQVQFQSLAAYSPYHNVPRDGLPPLMLTTADHDDRVVPLHSLKYAAAAQRAHGVWSHNVPLAGETDEKGVPVVIRVEVDAGHGAGKPLDKVMDEQADVFAFFAKYTGAQWRE